MMTCSLCGGTVSTCAACRGACHEPVCHACRDSDSASGHAAGTLGGPSLTVTLPASSPAVLI